MRNIKILFLLTLTLLIFNACVVEDDENPYYPPTEYGVYPNYLAGNNSIYNLLDPENSVVDFSIDASESGGAVATSGEIHAAINDGAFTKLADVASFPTNFSTNLSNVLSALGATTSAITGGDRIRFGVHFNTASETMTSTSYFDALILCAPIPGEYRVEMQDSYGDGWQGGGIEVVIDGVVVDFMNIPDGDGSELIDYFNVPEGSSVLTLEYKEDTWPSEVTFQIFDPNDDQLGDWGPSPAVGFLTLPSTCPN